MTDPNIYDMNIMEPVIEQKYDDEIDESCSHEDAVIISITMRKLKLLSMQQMKI